MRYAENLDFTVSRGDSCIGTGFCRQSMQKKNTQYIHMDEEKSELLSAAMDVLSDMDELQIRQCLAMMKAMKSVSVEK